MSAKILSETELSKGDLWVFGYGSLMWRPGFEFVEQVPARLIGEHRALCVYSFDHRGTPEKPGLVLGLDRGGACRGVAFRVAAKHRNDTVDYLRGREQATTCLSRGDAFGLARKRGRGNASARWPMWSIAATCNMPAGSRWREQLRYVQQGHGRSGNNRDYVLATVKSIEAQGLPRRAVASTRLRCCTTIRRSIATLFGRGSDNRAHAFDGELGTRPNNCACS